jgi:hypothetical protein
MHTLTGCAQGFRSTLVKHVPKPGWRTSLYIYTKLLVHLSHNKSLKMEPGCRNMESLYVLRILYHEVHLLENIQIQLFRNKTAFEGVPSLNT